MLSVALTLSPASDTPHFIGWQASQYTGKWYAPKWAAARKCIMYRESRFNYRAQNATSSAAGAYQFLDSRWRVSLTHMMMREAHSMSERRTIKGLREHNIRTWSRYWQDRAFYTAWRHGEGREHWRTAGGSPLCISLTVN